MADIKKYLDAIMEAEYGEQVRGSIHDAIEAINDEVQESSGGIKELSEGTPTDIDGLLQGKDGVLQKMTSYPILHTIDLPYPMDSNFRKILTYILPLDTSKDSYQITSMLTLLSKSQNSSLPVILCPYFQHAQNSMDYGGWVASVIYDLPPYNQTYINFWMVRESDNKFSIWIIGGQTSPDAHSISIVDMKLPMGVTVEYLNGSDIIASSDWNNYISGKYYNSTVSRVAAISNEFSNSKKIELTGAVTGSVNTTFSNGATIFTRIPDTNINLIGDIYGAMSAEGFKTGVTNYIAAYLDWHNIGEIPIENIPKGAIEKPKYVEDEAEMLTLTIEDVQNGDTVICTDHDPANMYLVVREDLLGTMEAFIQYKGGAATSIDWKNVHDAPTSFPADGGNSDTVGGKTIEELQDYENLNNTPDIPKEISNYINAHTDGEYIQETLKMPVSVGDDGKLYVEMPEWVAACLSADPSWTIITQYRGSDTATHHSNYWKLLERVSAIEKQLGLTVNWDSLSPAYVATKTANLLPTEENRLDVLIDDIEDGIVIKEETKNE